jgi:hypothetical protein
VFHDLDKKVHDLYMFWEMNPGFSGMAFVTKSPSFQNSSDDNPGNIVYNKIAERRMPHETHRMDSVDPLPAADRLRRRSG